MINSGYIRALGVIALFAVIGLVGANRGTLLKSEPIQAQPQMEKVFSKNHTTQELELMIRLKDTPDFNYDEHMKKVAAARLERNKQAAYDRMTPQERRDMEAQAAEAKWFADNECKIQSKDESHKQLSHFTHLKGIATPHFIQVYKYTILCKDGIYEKYDR